MAEFCLECLNKDLEKKIDEKNVIFSRDLEFCEGCGELKHVVITIEEDNFLKRFLMGF